MSDARAAALEYLHNNRVRFLEELKEYASIPSISTDPACLADVKRAAEWTADQLRKIGIVSVEVLPTSGHPVVFGEWLGAGPHAPTILVYGHYDVQPPDPLELWHSGPFEPVIKDGKIYARGSADDKGQFYMHVKALEIF